MTTSRIGPLGVLTSPGDILYLDGSNNLARLPAGADGQMLSLSGGVPSWSAATGLQQAYNVGQAIETTINDGSILLSGEAGFTDPIVSLNATESSTGLLVTKTSAGGSCLRIERGFAGIDDFSLLFNNASLVNLVGCANAPAASNGSGGNLVLLGGSGDGTGNGGGVTINAGAGGATGQGASVQIAGGAATNPGVGGAGSATLDGGACSGTGNGGEVSVSGGQAQTGNGGNATLQSGGASVQGNGGNVSIRAQSGAGTGNGGSVEILSGQGVLGGDITIRADRGGNDQGVASVNIQCQNPVGTNSDGGRIVLNPSAAQGAGVPGAVAFEVFGGGVDDHRYQTDDRHLASRGVLGTLGVAVVTTTERDALTAPTGTCLIVYNSTTAQLEMNPGGSGWVAV